MTGSNWIPAVFLYAALLGCNAGLSAADENAQLIRLTEDIYARIVNPDGNAVGNSGFIILQRGVLVFDTHFTPEAGRQLLEDIRTVTFKPVRYVVNSHHHPDHTHGNQVFPDAHVIANRGTRENILEKDLPSLDRTIQIAQTQMDRMRNTALKETDPDRLDTLKLEIRSQQDYLSTLLNLKIVPPLVVLEDYMSIQDGTLDVRIRFLGPGETDTGTVLYIPSERIVFCGDLFFKNALPNIQDADILKWMETLEKLLQLEADRFVPGHGIVGNRRDVENFITYFEDLRSLVEPYVSRGEGLDRALKEIRMPAKYSGYRFMNFFRANVQKMFTELKTLQMLSIPIEGPKKPKG